MSDPSVVVEVYDVPAETSCFSGGWGPSWSPEEITAIIRTEVQRRFGDQVGIEYVDVSRQEVRAGRAEMIGRIEEQGLLYPVTVIDGVPAYDGAVSYPAILRAVQNRLDAAREMA